MRYGKNIVAMANAGLGAKDATSLTSALKKYAPKSGGKCPPKLLAILGDRVVFAGKSSVAFISEAVAREEISAFYESRRQKGEEQSESAHVIEDVRNEVAKLRADLMAEIAKLRTTIERLRGDVDTLRNAQIAEKTSREKNHDALVGLLAEMQKEVANLRAEVGRNNKPNQQTQENNNDN